MDFGLQSKELFCPSCGNRLPIFDVNTRMVGCPRCYTTSVLDENQRFFTPLFKSKYYNINYATHSFIQLGQTILMAETIYRVVARCFWVAKVSQYFKYDGNETYRKNFINQERWHLLAENGHTIFLIFDGISYFLSEPMDVFYPNFGFESEKILHTTIFTEKEYRQVIHNFQSNELENISEYGDLTLHYLEGELPYLVAEGEEMSFFTYLKNDIFYAVETKKWELAPQQATYFERKYLSEGELRELFIEHPLIKIQAEERHEKRLLTYVWLLMLFILLIVSWLIK